MMQNGKMFLFVLLLIVVQAFFIFKFDLLHSFFPFLDGVPITSSYSLELRYLMNWYIPIIGISFYFSGYISETFRTQGIVMISRNFSKIKWVLKQYATIISSLFVFILFQGFIYYVCMFGTGGPSIIDILQPAIMYYATLLVLFSFQVFLDLFLSAQLSLLIVNIYIFSSVVLTKILSTMDAPHIVYYSLLANYGMSFKTGLSSITQFQTLYINPLTGFTILIALQTIILICSLQKVRKLDIL